MLSAPIGFAMGLAIEWTHETVPARTETKRGFVVKVRVGSARDGLGRWVSLLLDSSSSPHY
jgi:hypothetical protein